MQWQAFSQRLIDQMINTCFIFWQSCVTNLIILKSLRCDMSLPLCGNFQIIQLLLHFCIKITLYIYIYFVFGPKKKFVLVVFQQTQQNIAVKWYWVYVCIKAYVYIYIFDAVLIYLCTGCSYRNVEYILTFYAHVLMQVVPQRHHRPAGRGFAEESRHSWQLFGSTQQEKCRRFLPVCQVIMSAKTPWISLFWISNSTAEKKSYLSVFLSVL